MSRGDRSYGRRRDLLAASRLEEFKEWIQRQGYIIRDSPPTAIYEVLRIEKYDRSGNNPHIVFYRRDHDSMRSVKDGLTHLTVPAEGVPLVKRFIEDTRISRSDDN